MTRCWARYTWPALAVRHASPWRRKMSATSSFRRDMPSELRRRNQLDLQGLQGTFDLPDHVERDAVSQRKLPNT